ncbi:MAG: hypothetical protein BWK73_43805 [Thiothrix lacustris]|uniref:HNH nuclease domain-containing protein n=1 Tax=Thiothrix lacustris TaxID=525917 RepID=A0A1Y1QBM2_9GAMM|nr:MAG: hypothetical protein BWK73_43805 [Thiothrix lacustris]
MQLLEDNFPPTVHQDILDEVGLGFEAIAQPATQKRARRDPTFRLRVLEACDYRCAICNFSVRMENTPIALEAAHIKPYILYLQANNIYISDKLAEAVLRDVGEW